MRWLLWMPPSLDAASSWFAGLQILSWSVMLWGSSNWMQREQFNREPVSSLLRIPLSPDAGIQNRWTRLKNYFFPLSHPVRRLQSNSLLKMTFLPKSFLRVHGRDEGEERNWCDVCCECHQAWMQPHLDVYQLLTTVLQRWAKCRKSSLIGNQCHVCWEYRWAWMQPHLNPLISSGL